MANQDLDHFRQDTREWLEANCPMSMRQPIQDDKEIFWGGRNAKFLNEDQRQWFESMRDRQWIVPHWPREYGGGGLSKAQNKILLEEMGRLGCRKPIFSFGISMLGPALLQFGSEEQKMEHLPKIARGEIRWCQGYSEPNAGSDLASLATKAEDGGDHFVVTGQKVWTSYADQADWIFCLVRTNFSAPKHQGISFLLIDMATVGVSTRPILLISGKSPFCETFFDNVRVPKANLMGELDRGWTIAKFLLTHERDMIGGLGDTNSNTPLHEVAKKALGTHGGRLADPMFRSAVAKWTMNAAAMQMTISRAIDEAKAGQSTGANSSFFKYYSTELNKERMEISLAMNGFAGLGWEGDAFQDGRTARYFCRTKGNSIEGGTSEIQLNIIAKRILGLPNN